MKLRGGRKALGAWVRRPSMVLRRIGAVTMSVVTVAVLAGVDAVVGPEQVLIGLLAVGPVLAAVSGSPRAVLGVSAYTLGLVCALSWWPDQIWGSVHQLLYVVSTLGVCVISVGVARRLQNLEATASRIEMGRRALAAVVEQSADAIVGTDLDGVVTAWNRGAERIFGYSAGEAVGTPISRFSGSFAAQAAIDGEARMTQIRQGELGVHYEPQRFHKDGHRLDLGVTLSPVLDGDGVLVGTSRVARDLTATKQAETRQRAAEQSAMDSERMASIGQLAGGVAHDFNNLLGIILNFTAFAAAQTADNAGAQDDLGQVRLAAERAVALTRQLLTFARQDTVKLAAIDVNASIAEAQAMLTHTIGEHIDLIAVPSPVPILIHADAGHVQQILINLAINARDAMPDGGTLLIEATAVDLDEGQTDIEPPPTGGRYVRLLVSDTGTGMGPDVIAHIFEPFYTTKPHGQGTGLGLATVYGIVAAAGGSINVYSEVDIGTTFRVYFPVIDAQAHPVPAAARAATAPHGHGATVLIVEDEPALAQSVARILRSGGYTVLSAGDAAAALDLCPDSGVDLLLTDVVMRGMSGPRLAELLEAQHPGLRTLFMSAYTNGQLGATRIIEHGAAFIEKPFTQQRLLVEVDTALTVAAKHKPPTASVVHRATG